MKECKNSGILPCYREGYGVWHHSDDTHDKVYGLNKQMCDIGKTMNDPMKPLSEDTGRAVLGCCELLAKDASNAKRMMDDIVRRAEENIRLHNDNNKYARLVRAAYERKYGKPKEKDIMEEKKTKKMTKAEAFEWLKGKKIMCYAGIANIFDEPTKVEKLLLEIGCRYHFANHIGWRDWYWPLYGFIVDSKGEIYVAFEDQMDFFKQNLNEPISVDDILSIEIVEDGLSYDKVVELAKPLMAYLSEVGCRDSIRVSQFGIVHEPMSTLIFDNGIGE